MLTFGLIHIQSYTSSGSGSWTLDNNVITPSVSVSLGAATETTLAASMSVTHDGYQPIKIII